MKRLPLSLAVLLLAAAVGTAEAQRAAPRHPGGAPSSPPPSSGGGGGGGGGGSTASGRGDGGGGGGNVAVPRGGSGGGNRAGGSSGGGSRRHPGGGGTASDPGDSAPTYARPGVSGRPTGSYAVPRGTVPPRPRPGGDYHYWINPYWGFGYYPWGFGAYSLGYIMDPWYWGPNYGPWGYGYGGYGGGYYGGGGGYYGDRDQDLAYDQGNLRLKVKPRDATVKVDGYFKGRVDDFDGVFQKMKLDEGTHKIRLEAEGYGPLEFDVRIIPGETIVYRGTMEKR